ncbi:MAG TPA: amino acid--tRNA ligase-related protein, partial [Longimicrobiales bacterium]|nr:amino acid--tRNA ligase-related protein [Longimicrobiales bacterium]
MSGKDQGVTEERSYVIEDRIRKLEQLREQGVEPFGYSYAVTHTSAQARALLSEGKTEDSTPVRVAGRLVSMRGHGKTSFAHLSDRAGKIQLYMRKDELGEGAFAVLNLLDTGDWIGASGTMMLTKTGEVTVRVAAFEVLAKAIRPLPLGKEEIDEATGDRVVHGGFSDLEQRYRQRYADLAVHPEVREVFYTRTRVVTTLRQFLDARGYIEVETPVLQPLYGGASARPFVTHHNALDMRLYLRIADELYLKRLIVGGLERVYEISKDFRNEGIDRTHNPEFTMLEFYEAFADYQDMMRLVEEMLVAVVKTVGGESLERPLEGRTIDFTPPFARLAFLDAIKQ